MDNVIYPKKFIGVVTPVQQEIVDKVYKLKVELNSFVNRHESFKSTQELVEIYNQFYHKVLTGKTFDVSYIEGVVDAFEVFNNRLPKQWDERVHLKAKEHCWKIGFLIVGIIIGGIIL
jgi:hypothetical protein